MSSRTFRARKRSQIQCPQISKYLRQVEKGQIKSCERQKKLMKYIRKVFAEENLIIDTERLEKYSNFTKFFPFETFYPWEWFLLALFLCVFRQNGEPRWNELICILGRGSGKNGFISFISWCVISAANGISGYDVNIVANSEEQAMTSFNDVKAILDADIGKWKSKFKWNQTKITSKSTNSTIKYLTSAANSKDGGRPGMVVFDEVHVYKAWKIIEVMTTGLGKVDHGRTAYISSMGDVRDGVLDSLLEDCDAILNGDEEDFGRLPFVCTLDEPNEVHDEANWEKACPSWRYKTESFKTVVRKEYAKWSKNHAGGNASLMTRRMGIPQGDIQYDVATYENLVRASRELPPLDGCGCVLGVDLSATNDMTSAVLLFRADDEYFAIHHSWLCKASRDFERIDEQVRDYAEERPDILTIVDSVEIPASMISDWVFEQSEHFNIVKAACDKYRYDVLRNVFEDLGLSPKAKTVEFVRPTDHMRVQPLINSALITGKIAWGDERLMRWFANNTRIVPSQNGNYRYEKKEQRSRKTDGFMALVCAFCVADSIPRFVETSFDEVISW